MLNSKQSFRITLRRSRGLSIVPVTILASLLGMFVLSNSLQVTINQRTAANNVYQSMIQHQASEEIIAQAVWYSKPSKLKAVDGGESKIAHRGGAASAVIDGFITRKPIVTNCPGTSFPCVNFEIVSELEQSNMIASSTHVVGLQIMQVEN